MKICIFPGTFNPIHNAHISVARYVSEHFCFDKIIFIPACRPPHKTYDADMSYHRLNMVKLAISKYPQFEVSDIEYNMQGKSYTYLTLQELYKLSKTKNKISMIIGTDAFKDIESWYETDKLKNIVNFIVFKRQNDTINLDYLKAKGYNFKMTDMEFNDISSSEIRDKIIRNEDIKNYVSKEVEGYIKENGLYGYKRMA